MHCCKPRSVKAGWSSTAANLTVHSPGICPNKGTLLQGRAAAAPSPAPMNGGHGLATWSPRGTGAGPSHSQRGSIRSSDSPYSTWMKAQKGIFEAFLLEWNRAPKPSTSQAQHVFKAQQWLQKLSAKPNLTVLVHAARGALTCALLGTFMGVAGSGPWFRHASETMCTTLFVFTFSRCSCKAIFSYSHPKKSLFLPCREEGNTDDYRVSVSSTTQAFSLAPHLQVQT